MAKGDGWIIALIGAIVAIVSLFFWLFNTFPETGASYIWYFFSQIGAWWTYDTTLIGPAFSSVIGIMAGLFVLFPILFIVAVVFILAGIKTTWGPTVGAIILYLYPVGLLILDVIVPAIQGASFGTLISELGIASYIMLIAAALCTVGAAKNRDVI